MGARRAARGGVPVPVGEADAVVSVRATCSLCRRPLWQAAAAGCVRARAGSRLRRRGVVRDPAGSRLRPLWVALVAAAAARGDCGLGDWLPTRCTRGGRTGIAM